MKPVLLQDAELLLRVIAAALLGAMIGWQREHARSEAGVRTFAAVAFGSCVFGLLDGADGRISAQVVSGIGFLGAGIIMRNRGHVHGLTTAAALWAMAGIGLLAARGRFLVAAVVTLLLLGLLALPVKKWEHLDNGRK